MTPAELVASVQAAGGDVTRLGSGQAKLTGNIPPDLVHAIKADRDAFLEAWDDERKGRWDRVPPEKLLMRQEPPRWRMDVYQRVERYVRGQSDEVAGWVVQRGEAYRRGGELWNDQDCVASAMADVLHWQMNRFPSPEWQLAVFDEVAGMKKEQ